MEQAGVLANEWRSLVDNEMAIAVREGRQPAFFEMECRLGALEDRNFVSGITQTDAERVCSLLQKMFKSWKESKPAESDSKATSATESKTSSSSSSASSSKPIWETALTGSKIPRHVIRTEEARVEDTTHIPISDGPLVSGDIRGRAINILQSDPPLPASATKAPWEWISKDRMAFVDMRVLQRKYDCRLALKREQPVKTNAAQAGPVASRRSQLRRSFWTSDGCRIDLSAVASYDGGSTAGRGPPQLIGPTTFEAEIEVVDTTMTPDDAIAALVHWLLLLQSCFPRPKSCDAVDGRLLFLRLDEESESKGKEMEGVTADVLLVSVSRSVCRASK